MLGEGQVISCSTCSILRLTVYFMWLWRTKQRSMDGKFHFSTKNNTVKKMKQTAIGSSKFSKLNEQLIREALREYLYQEKVTLLRFFSTLIFSLSGKEEKFLLHAIN